MWNELAKPDWIAVYVTHVDQNARIEAISSDKEMSSEVCQVMSEERSAEKRRARVNLFKDLGYPCLHFPFVAHFRTAESRQGK